MSRIQQKIIVSATSFLSLDLFPILQYPFFRQMP